MSIKQKPTPSARRVLRLTESAVMLALATVLSLLKLVDLPYGGSVTAASMLPLLLVAYRYGGGWGCFVGCAYGLLQLAFSSSLSYVTGLWSVLAVIFLDFGAAFAAVGVAGLFRRLKSQPAGLIWAAVATGAARYLCHVVSGATVWAGISIPTTAALVYSVIYNATYMVPETVITAAAAYFVGSVVDWRGERPTRLTREKTGGRSLADAPALAAVVAAVVYDVAAIFPFLQDPDTGRFTVMRLSEVNWPVVGILTGAALLLSVATRLLRRKNR